MRISSPAGRRAMLSMMVLVWACIAVDPATGDLQGAADPRRGGRAVGWTGTRMWIDSPLSAQAGRH